jgi:hypothetical protein
LCERQLFARDEREDVLVHRKQLAHGNPTTHDVATHAPRAQLGTRRDTARIPYDLANSRAQRIYYR